jgi:hypothetical protein
MAKVSTGRPILPWKLLVNNRSKPPDGLLVFAENVANEKIRLRFGWVMGES